jgi:hypothetical protein
MADEDFENIILEEGEEDYEPPMDGTLFHYSLLII